MAAGRVVSSRAQGTDEQLALAVQTGDRAAEAELVRRYTALAYTLARPYTTVRSDFDDMRQESLIAIGKAARSYRADGGASFQSLVNLAIRRQLWTVIKTDNRMFRRGAQAPLSINATIDLDGHDEMTLEGTIADPFAVDPHDAVERSEELQTITRVIREQLSPLERESLIGLAFLDETYLETEARILGVDVPAAGPGRTKVKLVDNALSRARRKLRHALDLPEPRPLGVAA